MFQILKSFRLKASEMKFLSEKKLIFSPFPKVFFYLFKNIFKHASMLVIPPQKNFFWGILDQPVLFFKPRILVFTPSVAPDSRKVPAPAMVRTGI